MFKKTGDNIAICFNEEILKIAQVKGSGPSAKVVNVFSQDIKGVTEADLPKTIQNALKGFNAGAAQVSLVVHPNQITTKNIEIPSVDKDEIRSIVNLQAGRHTPFSREEIQIGFVNIGVYKSNYTKVLLVITNRNTLKKNIGVLDKLGIKIEKVSFAPEAIASLYSETSGQKAEASTMGIIDVKEHSTDFIITFQGLAITTRHIPIGKAQLNEEGSSAKDKIVEELKLTMESYQNEEIEKVPENFLLTTDDDTTKALKILLSGKLGWTVDIAPYLDHIRISQGILKQLGEKYSNGSFLDLVASAAFSDAVKINFIPEEIQMQKSIEAQGKEVYKAAILSILILVFLAGVFGAKIYFKKAFLSRLVENNKENREQVRILEKRSIETRLIRNYLAGRMVSLDVINEIYKNVPNEMYLTSVSMEEDGTINLQGISDIPSLVFNLGTALKESELFKSVDIKSMTAKKDREKDVSAFEISLKLATALEEDAPEQTLDEGTQEE